jgi:hypothetical protein
MSRSLWPPGNIVNLSLMTITVKSLAYQALQAFQGLSYHNPTYPKLPERLRLFSSITADRQADVRQSNTRERLSSRGLLKRSTPRTP